MYPYAQQTLAGQHRTELYHEAEIEREAVQLASARTPLYYHLALFALPYDSTTLLSKGVIPLQTVQGQKDGTLEAARSILLIRLPDPRLLCMALFLCLLLPLLGAALGFNPFILACGSLLCLTILTLIAFLRLEPSKTAQPPRRA